jgi:hypothetical protein
VEIYSSVFKSLSIKQREEETTVFRSSTRASHPWRTLVKRFEKPATSLFLTIGVAAFGFPLPAHSADASPRPVQQGASVTQANRSQPLADGVYLYGQSPQPEQIGSAYMVFQVNQGKVVGAFYMPRSSFDCFHGTLQPDRVALTITSSEEQASYPYSVALQPADSVAMAGGETMNPVTLEGFHRIQTLSSNDQRILTTCQADYQRRG